MSLVGDREEHGRDSDGFPASDLSRRPVERLTSNFPPQDDDKPPVSSSTATSFNATAYSPPTALGDMPTDRPLDPHPERYPYSDGNVNISTLVGGLPPNPARERANLPTTRRTRGVGNWGACQKIVGSPEKHMIRESLDDVTIFVTNHVDNETRQRETKDKSGLTQLI